MKTLPLTKGAVAIVDDEDYEDLARFKWCFSQGHGVLRGVAVRKGVRKHLYMHRYLMGVTDTLIIVDHINGNILDHRRSNLRTCTKAENNRNSSMKTGARKNKSGYKGVYIYGKQGKWKASIRNRNRTEHIGVFENLKDAARAYNEAALKYYGEFARLNQL